MLSHDTARPNENQWTLMESSRGTAGRRQACFADSHSLKPLVRGMHPGQKLLAKNTEERSSSCFKGLLS